MSSECLIDPHEDWEAEYRAFSAELIADGYESERVHPWDDFAAWIEQRRQWARGENLPEGLVPGSDHWLVGGDRLLALANFRHCLIPELEDHGGHIGYVVRPSERRKGYGTKLLALMLDEARNRGLTRLLLTCDPANIASAKIIQRNGGVLASESWSPNAKRVTSRYWIEL
jgi:predicted acetyltransferase